MFKGKDKSFNEDEKTIRPRDNSVEIRFFGPWGIEMPTSGHQIELASSEGSQINIGILICGQVILYIRRLGESIEEVLDIDLGSARDDDLQPRCLCGYIGQGPQETWATLRIATLVQCVNNKDESVLRVARKGADEIKEGRAFHRFRSEFWVLAEVFCNNGPKWGEVYGEFVDERGEDVYGLAQIRVVPPAEKRSSKLVSLVKACADRMGQRGFSDSG